MVLSNWFLMSSVLGIVTLISSWTESFSSSYLTGLAYSSSGRLSTKLTNSCLCILDVTHTDDAFVEVRLISWSYCCYELRQPRAIVEKDIIKKIDLVV